MDSKQNMILLLGSGLMSRPIVEYFLRFPNNLVTVASRNQISGESLVREFGERCSLVVLDVTNDEALKDQIRNHDIVCNMAPALH